VRAKTRSRLINYLSSEPALATRKSILHENRQGKRSFPAYKESQHRYATRLRLVLLWFTQSAGSNRTILIPGFSTFFSFFFFFFAYLLARLSGRSSRLTLRGTRE